MGGVAYNLEGGKGFEVNISEICTGWGGGGGGWPHQIPPSLRKSTERRMRRCARAKVPVNLFIVENDGKPSVFLRSG